MDKRTCRGVRAPRVSDGLVCAVCGARSIRAPGRRQCVACNNASRAEGYTREYDAVAQERVMLVALDARVRRQSPRGAAWWWR